MVGGTPPMESPYNFTVSMHDADGYSMEITVRKHESKDFLNAIQGLRAWVKTQAFVPALHSTVQRTLQGGDLPQVRHEEQPGKTQEDMPPTQSFAASKLVGTFDSERNTTYWKVKGVKIFKEFGVNVWPEVLEAAGFPQGMAAQIKDLLGWTASYTLKEGNMPDKVVRLMKSS